MRAGLRMLERLPELPSPGGEVIQARIGINTGRALIHLDVDPASGHGFMVGDAVNTAARLQSIAPPMGVVVGEATHGLTAGLFDYQAAASGGAQGQGGAGASLAGHAPAHTHRRRGADAASSELDRP